MKPVDEMSVVELKALAFEQVCQRDQANEALRTIGNLIALRQKEEHDKAQKAAEQS